MRARNGLVGLALGSLVVASGCSGAPARPSTAPATAPPAASAPGASSGGAASAATGAPAGSSGGATAPAGGGTTAPAGGAPATSVNSGAPSTAAPAAGPNAPTVATSAALQQLIAAARQEGQLDLVWSEAVIGGSQAVRRWTDGFNKGYGLDLNVRYTAGPSMALTA